MINLPGIEFSLEARVQNRAVKRYTLDFEPSSTAVLANGLKIRHFPFQSPNLISQAQHRLLAVIPAFLANLVVTLFVTRCAVR